MSPLGAGRKNKEKTYEASFGGRRRGWCWTGEKKLPVQEKKAERRGPAKFHSTETGDDAGVTKRKKKVRFR